MKRRNLLLPAALAGMVLLAAALARRRREPPPHPSGALAYNATRVTPRTYALGAFTVAWEEPGRLVVRHRADPERELWATLPGQSFVRAARAAGAARAFRQAGGFFFVEDRRLTTCANQFVDSLTAEADALTVAGRVQGQLAEVRYSLVFTALSERQLGLTLTLANWRFNRVSLTYASNAEEQFFGFGEQLSSLDLKGKRVPILVSEKGLGRGSQPLTTHALAPFYLTSQRRALCLENTESAVFDLRLANQVQVEVWGAPLKARIFYGATPADLVQAYTEYAGRMRPLPD